jgi:hypothetical protein
MALTPREDELADAKGSVSEDAINKYIKRAARYYRYIDRGMLGIWGERTDITKSYKDIDISKNKLKQTVSDYVDYYIERLEFREEHRDELKLLKKAKEIRKRINNIPMSDIDKYAVDVRDVLNELIDKYHKFVYKFVS